LTSPSQVTSPIKGKHLSFAACAQVPCGIVSGRVGNACPLSHCKLYEDRAEVSMLFCQCSLTPHLVELNT
jgi:hypothetical protein